MDKIKTSILIIITVITGFAQKNYTSIYSRFGIGELSPRGNSVNYSLGFAGIAYRNKVYLNSLNPASYTALDSMTFILDFGFNGKYTYLQTETVNENHYAANISYITIGFPITHWYFTTIGMKPFSSSGYSITNNTNVTDGNGNIITESTQNYTGEGDITQLYIGQAVKLTKKLSLGAHISYLYGKLNNITTLTLPAEFGGKNLNEQNKTYVNDFYFDFGTQYTHSFNQQTHLTIGVTYGLKKKISSQTYTTVTSFYGSSGRIDTLENTLTDRNKLIFPMYFGAGVSLILQNHYRFLFDYQFTDWKNSELFEKQDVDNSFKTNFGIEIMPNKNSLHYGNKISYRIGGYYKKSLIIVNNKNLKNFGITFGFGLPVRNLGTTFNFAFVLGQMGTTENGLIKENFVGFNISLSFLDKWFYKRKFD